MKNKSYLIIVIATVLAFTVAGTYAFFQILGGNTETRNVTVQTNTTDSLSFSVSKDIEITASQSDFGLNEGNKTDTTIATARLVPNSKTHEATATYNVYVVIDTNDFVYTTNNNTPELLLTVTDPNGNRIGNIAGLDGSNGVYNITTRTGAFKVADNYEISTNSAQGTTQNWTMTVTLVNLDSDQNANTGKTLTGTIYITKDSMNAYSLAELNALRTSKTVNNEEVSTITYDSITVDMDVTSGSEGIDKYYFGIEEQSSTGYIPVANQTINGIEFYESNEPTYTFTGLKDNTNYNVYAFVEDSSGFKSNIYSTVIKTVLYVLPEVTDVETTILSGSSIGVTATASDGQASVSKYYFNCGDGNGWSEAQDSNTYTCSGLTVNTNYNIQVKVSDTNNRFSTDYVKPSVIDQIRVTFDYNGATDGNTVAYKDVTIGEAYGELPVPHKKGYRFKGWYLGSKNIIDQNDLFLGIEGASYSNEYYRFVVVNAHNKYNSSYYPISNIKAATRYTMSYKAYASQVPGNNAAGNYFCFKYSDNTHTCRSVTSTTEASYSFTSDAGKTIVGVFMTYGTGGDYIIYVKDFQVEEGTVATEYESYYATEETISQSVNHTLTAVYGTPYYGTSIPSMASVKTFYLSSDGAGLLPMNSQSHTYVKGNIDYFSYDKYGSPSLLNGDIRANVTSGTNTLALSQAVTNSWIRTWWMGACSTGDVTLSNFKLRFTTSNNTTSGSYYTINQALNNGYIEPLVLYYNSDNNTNYVYPYASNILSGGSLGTARYFHVSVFLKVKSGYYVNGVTFNTSAAFSNSCGDGFYFLKLSDNAEISLKVF